MKYPKRSQYKYTKARPGSSQLRIPLPLIVNASVVGQCHRGAKRARAVSDCHLARVRGGFVNQQSGEFRDELTRGPTDRHHG